jgi:glycosyltransferase involved in cell wall biosynthesis
MKLVSVVIPVYNEAANLPPLHDAIVKAFEGLKYEFEVLFVDDGSTDNSTEVIEELSQKGKNTKYLFLSRNFGKEIALTAGIHEAKGDAVLTIDSDLQQPPELIPEFITKWEAGAEVVIGIRKKVERENVFRRLGSIAFYEIMNRISDVPFIPQSTDFRLLDRKVVDAFNQFTERNRLTRGLIDWLGFKRDFVYFNESKRLHGKASYSTFKLIRLALTSVTSHSLFPLKLAGYLGVIIFIGFGGFGLLMFFTKIIWNPFNLAFSGPAEIGVLNGFFIGIILMSLGIIAMYIGSVHDEVAGRPLFVIRDKK